MGEIALSGQRFRRIPHPYSGQSADVESLLSDNVEPWPHLTELLQNYTADWVKDESKYGHYESVPTPVFENQIFEGPDTDVETELRLSNIRLGRYGDATDDEDPTTSGRYSGGLFSGRFSGRSTGSDAPDSTVTKASKHYGGAPLLPYEPVFNWLAARASVYGQRTPEIPTALSSSGGLKISVKIASLNFQAGLVEPWYGTICLYHREKREKLSEDFHFRCLPPEFQDEASNYPRKAVFSLEAPSPAICLLVQLEKHVTEEGGITPSIYTRKEPIFIPCGSSPLFLYIERDKQKLQVWAKMIPFREPFAWSILPLFDAIVTGGVGGFSSPTNSPLPPGVLGSALMETSLDSDGRLIADSKPESVSVPVLVDVPTLHRVKENYTEEMLLVEHPSGQSSMLSFQEPKRKVQKPVKATLRLEIERLGSDDHETDCISECGSFNNYSFDADSHSLGASFSGRSAQGLESTKTFHNGHQKSNSGHRDLQAGIGSSLDLRRSEFRAVEFRLGPKPEPLSQLLHLLYVYPQSVTLNRKRNLFIRLELRVDDGDIRKPPLEALYPRDADSSMQKYVHTQIDANTKTPHFHDEFKVQLPTNLSPDHHLLFTFFHVELQTKLEAPKPVVVGYAVLPLLFASQVIRLDGTLPIAKELYPNYLKDNVKDRLEYLDDGKTVFKLRSRLCSSLYPVNERIRDFFSEYDRHILRTSPWGNELMEAVNALKNVEASAMLQFLQPCLNMLLRMIGDGGETLQVAAFRSMVNIITRVQGETSDGDERNRYLVQYLDYAFDDFGGRHDPVYPGLCSVWRSLARSKAKGYRVGPVYDDVLSMAWFFLELIVKSMALEQSRTYSETLPPGEELPPLQLNDEVFKSIGQLYDCLLTEVQERGKKGLTLANKLNSSLGFFCFDLLSVIEPRQVFELVALYFSKFCGVCETTIHEYKLNFLSIICDHDLFVEMPGRDPTERNYLASMLMQELFITWDHEDPALKAKACRILVQLLCKHEYDLRYQSLDDKLYIAQRYFPLVGLILDEMPVFYALSSSEKREILVCVLHILRYLDDGSLVKSWQQNIARTRLFFKLLEECQELFEYKKAGADGLMGAMPVNEQGKGTLCYSEKLSPAVNHFLSEASRQDVRILLQVTKSSPGPQWIFPQVSPDASTFWKRVSPVSNSPSSPNQPHSLREALAQAQSAGRGAGMALKESLHPMLRQKLDLWEENLSASVMLQLLEIVAKFMDAASSQAIATDYTKLDCITSIISGFLGRSQPLPFWKAFFPVFNNLFSQYGATLMSRDNDRFLKQVAFHLLRLGVFRNESIRKRAVVGLQILIRTAFHYFQGLSRLRVLLTITLSELMSDVQVTQHRMDGSLEESGESQRLRRSLRQIAQENISTDLLRESGLPEGTLSALPDGGCEQIWSWAGVHELSNSLLKAVEAAVGHALLGPEVMTADKYATAEAYYGLARAYSNVPDLHIMWLLYLCEVHQGNQSYAEAAQCAVSVAGVVMQAIVSKGDHMWGKEHVEALRKICPMLTGASFGEAASAEIEGYGSSKLTVESAVKYLQLANKLFVQGELFHFCAEILELIIPVHKARRAYGQLSKCHTSLTSIYEAIVEQESSPIPFSDATYYRVGFYGESFGSLNGKEYVYREARDVRLGDIMRNLGNIYEPRVIEGKQSLHIIPDSRQVKPEDLHAEICYMQITSVEPVTEDDILESRRDRHSSKSVTTVSARVFNRFLYDTPFTKNGKSQGGLEDQWKRRTVLWTEGSFPALVNRLTVVKSESREFSPIENAIGMIETRTAALAGELDDNRLNEGDHPSRLQSLQRILQGSVAVQVNSGVLGVCAAFFSGEPSTRLSAQDLQELMAALMEFMAVCKKALRIHARLITEEDQEFHSQLVIGFQSLTAELSHFIPAILSGF
ncbi:guanine nucleotide exchange factor SPIKE 1 isoform X2 [Physcomitrium patens]|uniref:guanine nucleotide exchange factor SPIKE 1 isoform X2 n=1 Tax=Physcomitrium patens TaxID=3218 RepID=UPI000D174D17|nr:guanine nucleotide exchange factor SPIKE 1-like isoform X2 [Physcomitrium patens]|eukprot:XP_024386470.1 guanine nucleotide exchange factor SPIKE 1-like isoform X2 [Physcomitrella patens]